MRLISIVIQLLLLSLATFAAVPPIINYQGKLTGADGKPVADGTYNVTFAIYSVPTGGTPLWSEPNAAVQVKGGVYSVLLGSVVNLPANIFDAPDRFFGVKVGDGAELAPRQQIASVPFAMKAAVADTVADRAITTAKIALQQDWQTAQVLNGWQTLAPDNLGPISFYKDTLGIVRLRGVVHSGNSPIVLTLPVGYRPHYRLLLCGSACNLDGGFTYGCSVEVQMDGTVAVYPQKTQAWVSLSSIAFRAEQ